MRGREEFSRLHRTASEPKAPCGRVIASLFWVAIDLTRLWFRLVVRREHLQAQEVIPSPGASG